MGRTILFVNGSAENSARLHAITDALARRYGKPHLLFYSSESNSQSLSEKVAASQIDALVIAIGPDWPALLAQPQFIELLVAALSNKTLIAPVLLDQTPMPEAASLPEPIRQLTYRQAYRISTEASRKSQITQFVASLDRQLGNRPPVRFVLWGFAMWFALSILTSIIQAAIDIDQGHATQEYSSRVIGLVPYITFGIVWPYAVYHTATRRRWRWFGLLGGGFLLSIASFVALNADLFGVAGIPHGLAIVLANITTVPAFVGVVILFLYGVGDAYLISRPLRSSTPQEPDPIPSVIFISYRRDDAQAWSDRVYAYYQEIYTRALRGASGRLQFMGRLLLGSLPTQPVFRDVDIIAPGANFQLTLRRAVSGCGAMVVLMGPNWLALEDSNGHRRIDHPEDFVRFEIKMALDLHKQIHVLLVDGATLPAADALPADIRPLARCPVTRLSDATPLAQSLPFLPLRGWRRVLWMISALFFSPVFVVQTLIVIFLLFFILALLKMPTPSWLFWLFCLPLASYLSSWFRATFTAVRHRQWQWAAFLTMPIWLLVVAIVPGHILMLIGLAPFAYLLGSVIGIAVILSLFANLFLPYIYNSKRGMTRIGLSSPGQNY